MPYGFEDGERVRSGPYLQGEYRTGVIRRICAPQPRTHPLVSDDTNEPPALIFNDDGTSSLIALSRLEKIAKEEQK